MRVRIVALQDGFRRCGIAHPAQPVEYPGERFSAAELARLQAEPMLDVELLDDEPAQPLAPLPAEVHPTDAAPRAVEAGEAVAAPAEPVPAARANAKAGAKAQAKAGH